MHVSDALIFPLAVKTEGCDQDGNLSQLPDFKTEDIKNFDNCNDFPNGKFVPNAVFPSTHFFHTFFSVLQIPTSRWAWEWARAAPEAPECPPSAAPAPCQTAVCHRGQGPWAQWDLVMALP